MKFMAEYIGILNDPWDTLVLQQAQLIVSMILLRMQEHFLQ